MSRWGPQILPDEGPDYGSQIVRGFEMLARRREESRLRALEDEDRAFSLRQRTAQEYDQGIVRGQAPVQAAVGPSAFGNLGAAASNAQYQDLGQGYYRDLSRTPEARAQRSAEERSRSAFAQLQQLEPERYRQFNRGIDYGSQLAGALDGVRAVALEGVRSGNRLTERAADNEYDLGLERLQQGGRVSLAELNNRADMARTVYSQGQANFRHSTPSASSVAATGGQRGFGGIRWNEAQAQARLQLTRPNEDGRPALAATPAELYATARAIFEGKEPPVIERPTEEAAAPRGPGFFQRLGNRMRGGGETPRRPAPAPARRQTAPAQGAAAPRARVDSVATQRSEWDQAAAALRRTGITDEGEVIAEIGPRP